MSASLSISWGCIKGGFGVLPNSLEHPTGCTVAVESSTYTQSLHRVWTCLGHNTRIPGVAGKEESRQKLCHLSQHSQGVTLFCLCLLQAVAVSLPLLVFHHPGMYFIFITKLY